ncbi:MAG: M50 family metallopeptidase [Oscillospiraceae bacterium]|nr:M50 family metallopeptidase [Oscillospiraceae bacterium]
MIIITTVLIVVIAVVLFLLVILIHEFGHFITAKMFGVKVIEFAIGMGPKIAKWQGKETLYTLRLLPIGGFCMMEGEDEDSPDERSINRQKVWKRLIILTSGAFLNIVLGLIFMFALMAQQEVYADTTIAKFSEDAATYSSGLRVNDEIDSINGYKVFCYTDARFAMAIDEDGIMDFVVVRDGEKVPVKVTFDTVENEGLKQTVLDFKVYGYEQTFGTVLKSTFEETVSTIRVVYVSLWRLVTGQEGMKNMAGPVGIAQIIGEAADAGFKEGFKESFMAGFLAGFNNILNVMALITVNLGIFNLLPLPALDGGRVVFLLIEGVRRKPINPKYEGIVHAVGLLLFFALMIVITYNDIVRLITGG